MSLRLWALPMITGVCDCGGCCRLYLVVMGFLFGTCCEWWFGVAFIALCLWCWNGLLVGVVAFVDCF